MSGGFQCRICRRSQQLALQVVPPEHPQEVNSLLGLLDHCRGVCGPGEVSRDENAQVFKGLDLLHTGTVNVKRCEVSPFLSEVMISFVFVVFRSRLFDEHQAVSFNFVPIVYFIFP